jgi:hypothetical protein
MQTDSTRNGPPRGRPGMGFLALLALTLAAGSGCRDLLLVDNPQDILVEDLETPEAVPVVMRGVVGDFAWTYSYTIQTLGYFSNELIHTGSSTGWRELEVGIAHREGVAGTVYNRAVKTAWAARNAAELIAAAVPDPRVSPELARVKLFSGYTYLLLADNFCRIALYGGAAQQPEAVYLGAEASFTEAAAIAGAASQAPLRQQALAGRARARLMLGDYAGARDDAREIPGTFRFTALYSEAIARENNFIPTQTTARIRKEGGVHPRYYTDARYVGDPRTRFIDQGDAFKGEDRIRQFVEQTKYPVRSSPANISSWQEVRLIEAEAEARLGNLPRAVELINGVRSAVELPPYGGPATEAAVLDQIFFERSAQLFLEGKILVDLRRSGSPLLDGRAGCLPISYEEEESNPNLKG